MDKLCILEYHILSPFHVHARPRPAPQYPGEHVVFESSQTMTDIPYGDCFTVDLRWDVHSMGPPSGGAEGGSPAEPQAGAQGGYPTDRPSSVQLAQSLGMLAQQGQQGQSGGGAVETPFASAAGGQQAGSGLATPFRNSTAGPLSALLGAGSAPAPVPPPLPQMRIDITVRVPFNRRCLFKKVRAQPHEGQYL